MNGSKIGTSDDAYNEVIDLTLRPMAKLIGMCNFNVRVNVLMFFHCRLPRRQLRLQVVVK